MDASELQNSAFYKYLMETMTDQEAELLAEIGHRSDEEHCIYLVAIAKKRSIANTVRNRLLGKWYLSQCEIDNATQGCE